MSPLTALLLFSQGTLTEAEAKTLHRDLTQPEVWRSSIPWKTCPWEAREQAVKQRKPIFCWVGNWHPLGRCGPQTVAERWAMNRTDVADFLRENFICFVRSHRQKEAPRAFPKGKEDMGKTFCILSSDGEVVENFGASIYFPDELRGRLVKALSKFAKGDVDPRLDPCPNHKTHAPKVVREAPYVNVTAKIIDDVDPWLSAEKDRNYVKIEKLYLTSVGRDHLPLEKEEVAALARDEFPQTLKRRMASMSLVDSIRGHGGPSAGGWKESATRKLEIKLENGRVTGSFEFENKNPDGTPTRYAGALFGWIEFKEGTLARFDLVAKGECRGAADDGGRVWPVFSDRAYTLAVAFQLIPNEAEAALLPTNNAWHSKCPDHPWDPVR